MASLRRVAAVLVLCLVATATTTHADSDTPQLVVNLGSSDSTVRNAAYTTLMSRKDPKAIPLLHEAVGGFDVTAQSYTVYILRSYPADVAIKALRPLVKMEPATLRVHAAAELLRKGENDVLKIILAALDEPQDDAALSTLLSRLYSIRDETLQARIRALLDPKRSYTVLGAALYCLYTVQDGLARAEAEKLLVDTPASVRALAAAYLLRFGQPQRAQDLADALASGEVEYSAFSRVNTFLYSMPSIPARVLQAITKLLETETESSYLSTMIRLLAKAGYRPALPQLKKLIDDSNTVVSKAAFDALAGFPGALDADDLRELLASDDASRRLKAADALRRQDDVSGLPVVLEIAKNDAAQRADAIKVLGGFRQASVVEPLIDALMDANITVRANAYSGLGTVLRALFPYRRLDLASTGYSTSASQAVRAKAVDRIRSWWNANKVKDW